MQEGGPFYPPTRKVIKEISAGERTPWCSQSQASKICTPTLPIALDMFPSMLNKAAAAAVFTKNKDSLQRQEGLDSMAILLS